MRRPVRLLAVASVLALAVGLGAPTAAVAAGAVDIRVTIPEADRSTAITNAQLRWGLNAESGSGAYAGGCNFLSAGAAGDSGGAVVWTEASGLYRAAEGNVRVEKPDAAGEWRAASYASRCLDPNGLVVSASTTTSVTGNQVVIDGGRGRVVPGSGTEIRWAGSFTVAFYGGMTYWSVTDPVLTVDAAGNGRLTGTASGYGTAMDDLTKWTRIEGRSIVLAEVRGAEVQAAAGFATVPEFLGVSVSGAGQIARTDGNAAHWGAFPQSFVDFHALTGQQGYWVSSGGLRDAAKPASTLYVSYDAAAPVAVPSPVAGSAGAAGGGAAPSNPVRFAPTAAAAQAAQVPVFPLAAVAATTTVPQRQGLIPDAVAALSPLVVPLLGSALALLVAIVAVLALMQALPWQRRGRPA